MTAWIGRKYKLSREENFDEYLKAIGLNTMMRRIASSVSPVIYMTQVGDEFTYTSETTFRTTVTKFKLGEEFEANAHNSRKVKCLVTLDGNKFTEIQKFGDEIIKIERVFNEFECVTTYKYKDIVCTKWHNVIN